MLHFVVCVLFCLFVALVNLTMQTFSIVHANNTQVPWTTIWGLMKFAIYGGRIDNEQDIRVLYTYLVRFFHAKCVANGNTPPQRRVSKFDLPVSCATPFAM
jgi:hypothetical protein